MMRKTYTVAGMTCPNCAMKLEGMEDDIPGVQRVIARYRNGTVEIEFDEHQVDEIGAQARRFPGSATRWWM